MLATILIGSVLAFQDAAAPRSIGEVSSADSSARPVLRPGDLLTGAIDSSSPVIETERLRATYESPPTRGNAYRVAVAESAQYRIRAESAFVRPYLVLRDSSGTVLGEDDFSRWGILPEVVTSLVAGQDYVLEVASLYGDPGPYTVRLEPREGANELAEEPQLAALTDR